MDNLICVCGELLASTPDQSYVVCCGGRLHKVCMQQWRRWTTMKENGETDRMARMECECETLASLK